jgi:hypothetical protein
MKRLSVVILIKKIVIVCVQKNTCIIPAAGVCGTSLLGRRHGEILEIIILGVFCSVPKTTTTSHYFQDCSSQKFIWNYEPDK